MRILIIEDEPNLLISLCTILKDSYQVDCASTGQAGLRKLGNNQYDLILLDLNLGDMNGLEICERVRGRGIKVPILVITGEASPQTKVTLLDSGANDYVTKPFNRLELEARIRALIRQNHDQQQTPARLVVEDLTVDTISHTVTRQGVAIHLRPKEYLLLECLIKQSGQIVSRETLANYAWKDDFHSVHNTVHVHMTALRQKIDQPFGHSLIKTVHGFGYKIDASKLVVTT